MWIDDVICGYVKILCLCGLEDVNVIIWDDKER